MKAATVPAYPPDPPRGSITEGLDIVPAFSTLIREGKAAQYHWLAEAMRGKGVWPSPSSWEGMRVASLWEGFEIEQRAVSSTTELPPTYLRTVRVWIGMKERPCTEEEVNDLKDGVERRGWEWDPDLPRTTSDIHIATGPEDEQYPGAFPTTADLARHQFPKLDIPELGTEEHFRRWAEEFAAEVTVCVDRFKEHEGLPNELTRLIAELRTFVVGTAEGAGLIGELRGKAQGQGILATMNDGKARLLQRLEGIAADLSVTDFKPTSIIRQLIYESKQLDTRATKVDALLNDNYKGPNPTAFVEFIRGEVLRWKQDAASSRPKPTPMEHFIAVHGIAKNARVSVEPWLVDRCERWLASVDGHATPTTATTKPKPAKKSSAFTVPVLARFCWCMEKAGHSDHGIVNATAASRLANRYGLLHYRTGEKLKQERDRFDGADGKPYLKGGSRSNEAYGRRTWAAVKVELERIGYSDAVRLAEAILSDL